MALELNPRQLLSHPKQYFSYSPIFNHTNSKLESNRQLKTVISTFVEAVAGVRRWKNVGPRLNAPSDAQGCPGTRGKILPSFAANDRKNLRVDGTNEEKNPTYYQYSSLTIHVLQNGRWRRRW